jgi:two-component system, chemotaxis family, protein-glutamate methylesterase/glutaminase
MPGHDIIVIGASAGGVEALLTIARALPADLPAAVFVVLHVSPYSRSVLPNILSRAGALAAAHPRNGDPIANGHIYVAPPDHHLLVHRGRVEVVRGPQENSCRPAVDPLFRTAAVAYRRRVVGVVLTGNLDDGTAGLAAIERVGGIAIVQDPDEALYPGMPTSAVENVPVNHVVSLPQIAPLLVRLAHEPVEDTVPEDASSQMKMEADISAMRPGAIHNEERPGKPSVFACPDCHGTLFEIEDGELARFRCRVGHAYSPESLLAAQANGVEEALWTALRALEEKIALTKRLLERMMDRGHKASVASFQRQMVDTEQQAEVLRQVLMQSGSAATVDLPRDTNEAVADAPDDARLGRHA